MVFILVEQLMKTMFLDYPILAVVILFNTFGLMLAALVKRYNIVWSCPCTSTAAYSPPSFVGNNYYCESAPWYCCYHDTYFFNDTLWDGAGCVDNYCDDTTQPWFYRQLNQTTQDDIEARICSYGLFIHRSTLIDQLELYIQ